MTGPDIFGTGDWTQIGKKKQRLWRVATSLDTVPKGGVPGSTVYLFHWHLSCQKWSRFAMATVHCLRKEYASTVPDDVSSLGPLIFGCSVWRHCDAQNPQYLPSSLTFPAVCTMTRKFPTNQTKLIWEGQKEALPPLLWKLPRVCRPQRYRDTWECLRQLWDLKAKAQWAAQCWSKTWPEIHRSFASETVFYD